MYKRQEIKRIVRNYYDELCAINYENLDVMDKLLEKYNLPKLNEEEAGSLNRPITTDEIETAIKKLPTHKSPRADGVTRELYRAFKEELKPILHRPFQKIQEDGSLPNSFYEASIILIPNQTKTQERKKTRGQYR